MSARQVEPQIAAVHPRETSALFGHRDAEMALLNAYRSGRIPHAWLIGGPAGHRQGDAGLPDGAVRARASRSAGRGGAARRDAVGRSLRSGRAPRRGRRPWRPAHAGADAQRQGRDADRDHRRRDPRDHLVLRLDRGGRGLAGLHRRYRRRAQSRTRPMRCSRCSRSRRSNRCSCWSATRRRGCCRRSCRAAANCRCGRSRPATSSAPRPQAANIAADDPALAEAAEAAEGSVARALTLLGGDALKLHQRTAALLATLPRVDPRELHALGDALGASDRVALSAFIDSIDRWVERTAARRRRQCQRQPSPPCTAGGGVGKDQPRRARHRRIQSRAKTAGFLGVRAACGSDAVSAPPTINPDNHV